MIILTIGSKLILTLDVADDDDFFLKVEGERPHKDFGIDVATF